MKSTKPKARVFQATGGKPATSYFVVASGGHAIAVFLMDDFCPESISDAWANALVTRDEFNAHRPPDVKHPNLATRQLMPKARITAYRRPVVDGPWNDVPVSVGGPGRTARSAA